MNIINESFTERKGDLFGLVIHIISFMCSAFLCLAITVKVMNYGYVTTGHTLFLILFAFLSGAFLVLGVVKFREVSDEY